MMVQDISMNLSGGRQFLNIPGPTIVPDEVMQAMLRPAIDIYGGEIIGITDHCLERLKSIFKTKGRTYIYISNGHGAWEAALTNTLSRGDKILVLEGGRFPTLWAEMANQIGIEVEFLKGDWRCAVNADAVENRLREDKRGEIKAVLVVHVDTASGVVNDIPAIRAAMDRAGTHALYMVDAIASLATMPFEMDEWGVDVAITASQKGLMMTPGLGLVAAGQKAIEAHKTAGLRTGYWDWTSRDGAAHYQKYCGTPPIHLLFGLDRSLKMIMDQGLKIIFDRHRAMAAAVHAAVEQWSKAGILEFNILNPVERAPSVTTILMNGGYDPEALRVMCREQCNVILGSGMGNLSRNSFRIAHMGHVNAPTILGSLAITEAALRALNIPCGDGGIGAATSVISRALNSSGR
jgi:alanine-glyoxylate transaminase/serine-glyoxylate transaminase/serine-pyruvate transaminase